MHQEDTAIQGSKDVLFDTWCQGHRTAICTSSSKKKKSTHRLSCFIKSNPRQTYGRPKSQTQNSEMPERKATQEGLTPEHPPARPQHAGDLSDWTAKTPTQERRKRRGGLPPHAQRLLSGLTLGDGEDQPETGRKGFREARWKQEQDPPCAKTRSRWAGKKAQLGRQTGDGVPQKTSRQMAQSPGNLPPCCREMASSRPGDTPGMGGHG